MKILDRYIIKTFLGPFLFIFSVLFFIFVVNIIWIQMAQFVGKGLSNWQIIKLFFYLGVSVVSWVLPLTILLSSIMTLGNFGERYELAAMKASGISLTRVMAPLFIVSICFSIVLFLFQNNVSPSFQKKAKNMLYNIAATKPALNFTPGQFISQIPEYTVKFDRIYGENGQYLDGIFIHKKASSYENQQAIVAKSGEFVTPDDRNYLKLLLYNGYIYDVELQQSDFSKRIKQPNQTIKFDTLVKYFDISEIMDKAIEKEQITDDYRFLSYWEINKTLEKQKKENDESFRNMGLSLMDNVNSYIGALENLPSKSSKALESQYLMDTISDNNRLEALKSAYFKIEEQKRQLEFRQDQVSGVIKEHSKIVMHQQRMFAFSFTCVIFFLIGASLGSIIRKGGMGLPVVISIVIFVIFHTLNLTVENFSWKGELNPYWAAWLPNLILFPFSIWLTYKALSDSQLFDAEKYKAFFKPLWAKFQKQKEHQRYQ